MGDSRVRGVAAEKGVSPAWLAKLGTCWQPTACLKPTRPQTKTSPSHQIPSHPTQQILPAAPIPARRPYCRPRLTRAPGCRSWTAKLWAAGLPGGSYKRCAATAVFFALGECRRLASKAIGSCEGPPQSPAFSPRSISPIRGFSSLRRAAKLFMAALLKARGCAAALSTLASLPPPAADPHPAATGPAPPAHGAVGTAGHTGSCRGAEPVPRGGRSPPAVPVCDGIGVGPGQNRNADFSGLEPQNWAG